MALTTGRYQTSSIDWCIPFNKSIAMDKPSLHGRVQPNHRTMHMHHSMSMVSNIFVAKQSHDGFCVVTVCSNASNVKFENSFVLVWFDLVLFAFNVARVVGHIITLFKIVFTRHKHLSIVIILFHPWYLSIWFFLFSVCSWMLYCVYFSLFLWIFFLYVFFRFWVVVSLLVVFFFTLWYARCILWHIFSSIKRTWTKFIYS